MLKSLEFAQELPIIVKRNVPPPKITMAMPLLD